MTQKERRQTQASKELLITGISLLWQNARACMCVCVCVFALGVDVFDEKVREDREGGGGKGRVEASAFYSCNQ